LRKVGEDKESYDDEDGYYERTVYDWGNGSVECGVRYKIENSTEGVNQAASAA